MGVFLGWLGFMLIITGGTVGAWWLVLLGAALFWACAYID